MDNKVDYIELVRQAQLGDKDCLNRLAELSRERLRAYVYRLTLADDLAQDIVQESMLEMFKVLGKLKRADRFWPWLCGIAFNKTHQHYRTQRHQKAVSLSNLPGGVGQGESQDGLANLVTQELKQIVLNAMARLQPRYRTVLTMRCYEEMQYSEIAELMGCSEFGVRVLFHRAKKALAKQLSRQGLGKGSLLTALVLFGKLTAPSEAAAAEVSITTSTVNVGTIASLIGVATSKTIIVPLAAAGVLAVGTTIATPTANESPTASTDTQAKSSYAPLKADKASEGVEDCWYFFPEGAAGPVMTRLMKWNESGKDSYCQWLQNDHANYFFDRRKNTIYINNFRTWASDLAVRRLPIDKTELSEFLANIEDTTGQVEYIPDKGPGLLVIARRSKHEGEGCWIIRHYNVLDEEYFRYNWPAGMKFVDNRDAMHRRGWTYFTITGEIDGEVVSGQGRIPFVYETSGTYWPWLSLQVGNKRFVNSGFKGLPRPWMGLHTIDTVRRDAAEQSVRFETGLLPGGDKAEVSLSREQVKLVYTIDMKKDVIEKITFSVANRSEGELRFSYLQEIEDVGDEFIEPGASSYGGVDEFSAMMWLFDLATEQAPTNNEKIVN